MSFCITDLLNYIKLKYQVALLYSTLCYNLTFVPLRAPLKPKNSTKKGTKSIFVYDYILLTQNIKGAQEILLNKGMNEWMHFYHRAPRVYVMFILHLPGNNPGSCYSTDLTHSLSLALIKFSLSQGPHPAIRACVPLLGPQIKLIRQQT